MDFQESAGVPFLCYLPESVVHDIIQNTPFVSWGCFVMSCKAAYEQYAQNEELAAFLYTKISLGSSCRSFSHAISKRPDPTSTLTGLSKYLRHTIILEIERQKSFNDYCLRTLHGFCPSVTSLTLTSCPMIRGGLGLTSTGQIPLTYLQSIPTTQEKKRTKLSRDSVPSPAIASTSTAEDGTTEALTVDPQPGSSEIAMVSEEAVLESVRPPSAIGIWIRQLKTLSLTACGLKDAEFIRLAPLMGGIERLSVKSSLIQTALPSMLQHASSLKHLYLDGCWKLRTNDLEEAMQMVPMSLETLSLKSCEHASNLALSRALARCGPSLKMLNIKFNTQISHYGLEAIRMKCTTGNLKYIAFANLNPLIPAEMWNLQAPNWTNVEYLDISVNPTVNDETIKTLSGCRSVTNLNLRGTAISDESIAFITRSMPKLLYLDVSACQSLQSLPDLWLLTDLCRLSCPECPSLSLSSLYPQFELAGQQLKFITKYDLSFTPIDDQCIVALVLNAFWLSHLSIISCAQITDISIHAIFDLLSNPSHTASFFSLGVCKTPKVSDLALRKLKLKFATKSLRAMEYIEHNGLIPLPLSRRLNPEANLGNISQPSASSSNTTSTPHISATPQSNEWELPEEIRTLPEDSITISCARGGRCQTKSICQCAQIRDKTRTTSIGTATLHKEL